MVEGKTLELLIKIYDEMQNSFNSLNNKIDKNTLLLEDLTTKVKTIAEVQKSHMEQNEKAHNEISKPLVEMVTIRNTCDAAYLKSVK